jgi:tRNA (cmo5U34)-methyltransferase
MNQEGKDFSFSSIENFDDHIDLSIPNYKLLTEIISSMSRYFIVPGTLVYDLGCSTGKTLHTIATINSHVEEVKYVGIDIESKIWCREYEDKISFNQIDLVKEGSSVHNCSLALSIFTLQFLPDWARAKLIADIAENINPGGAFIVAEKTYVESGRIQDLFTFSYYDFKMKTFDVDTIFGKQMKLRTIMKPWESDKTENLLKGHFDTVEPFFQTLLFKAWICIK